MKHIVLKDIVVLYLKTFAVTGLPFTIFVILFSYSKVNIYSWAAILGLAITLGTVVTLAILTSHLFLLKHQGIKEFSEKNLNVDQSESMTSHLDLFELKYNLPLFFTRLEIVENTSSKLIFRTSDSWISPGEIVTVIKEGETNRISTYMIRSRPRYKIITTDMGKNRENIRKVKSLLL